MRLFDLPTALLGLIALAEYGTASQHTSNWAVLVSTSRFWFNYRHMANTLSMYRTVKRLGIPDSQIILMLPDDMACNPRNTFAGSVFNDKSRDLDLYDQQKSKGADGDGKEGPDVAGMGGIEVDYRGNEVTVESFIRLLTDRWPSSHPTSKRLMTDDRSNILIYMTGHGGDSFLKFQDAEEISSHDLADAFEQMYEKKRYNEMLFMIDTCQANTMYEQFYSPGVIGTGSSAKDQSSYSHHADQDVGVAVIDRWTYFYLEFLETHLNSTSSDVRLGEMFDYMTFDRVHSEAGVRYDLYQGGEEAVRNKRVLDFFGNVQGVDVDAGASGQESLSAWKADVEALRQITQRSLKDMNASDSVMGSKPSNEHTAEGTVMAGGNLGKERVAIDMADLGGESWTKKALGAGSLLALGRKCDGYDAEQQLLPTARAESAPVGRQMYSIESTKKGDRRAFDFFLSCAGKSLAGKLDLGFWYGTVLQLAQTEPFIFDSIVAISTLYEHPQYLQTFSPERGDVLNEHRAYALKSYNKAIQAFRKRVEAGKASPALVLLSSVLFVCIEIIQDDIFNASALLMRTSGLMREFECARMTAEEAQLFANIKLMFSRLGVLAAAFGHPHPIDLSASGLGCESRGFQTMADARSSLFAIMADSHPFIRDSTVYKAFMSGEAGDGNYNTVEDDCSGANVCSKASSANFDHGRRPVQKVTTTTVTFISAEMGQAANFCTDSFLSASDRLPDFSGQDPDKIRLVMQHEGLTGYVLTPGDDLEPAGVHQHNLSDSTWEEHVQGGDVELFPETAPNFASPKPFIQLLEEQTRLERRLQEWLETLRQTPDPESPGRPTETNSEVSSNLMMYYHVTHIWLSTRLVTEQVEFDQYTNHFEQTLRYGEKYVNAKAGQPAVFTFEVGAVPPLYFVATKCRVPSLRRHALRLLARAPRKEAMWGATSTGQLAARIIAVEEEGMGITPPMWNGEPLPSSAMKNQGGEPKGPFSGSSDTLLPAEKNRVHNMEILRGRDGEFHVRTTRYRKLSSGALERMVQDFPI
ncbi:hypothetical protein D0869_10745 [Hortaea werneckii]|uniref:GPI-anchor transamidase n=1 Tax=Hortaea werneckii TaxID=91943 RepID=A0A3M6WD37_HORWE|nr:hypothetical protein D0869_10745 [Hortaea werneckii]